MRSMAKSFCVIAIITYKLKLLLVFLLDVCVRHVVRYLCHIVGRCCFFSSPFLFLHLFSSLRFGYVIATKLCFYVTGSQ